MSTNLIAADGLREHRDPHRPSAGRRNGPEGFLGLVLLSGVVSAVVALAASQMPASVGEFFGLSWAALWIVAIATMVLTARGAFALGNYLSPKISARSERRRRRQEDLRFLEFARLDPRVMADIDGAVRRADWTSAEV